MEFQVGGLTELATVRPLGEIQFPETLRPEVVFSAKWGDHSIQRWTTADGDLIELEFIATISHKGWYGLGLTTSPVVRVKGERRPVEEWMSQ